MRTKIFIVMLAAATQVGATDCGKVLRDPGFDLWCGEQLCTWKIVRGDAARVATWHEEDAGVELLGVDAAIAQLAPVTSGDGSCIQFDLVANVDPTVEARLGLDVFGDGSIDLSERLPSASWKPLTYKIRIAGRYSGIRFELSKRGQGRAVFAQIAATIATDCEGLTEVVPAPAPLGAPCDVDASCASGSCRLVPAPSNLLGIDRQCVGCDATSCDAPEVCGLGDPTSPVLAVPTTCVPSGAREIGEQCVVDTECGSGICQWNMCSTCDAACGAEACAAAYPRGPWVCAPGQHLRTSGEPCATDDDCASSTCNGAVRKQCLDARACDGPGDCPVLDDLAPGECTAVGVQGGRCQ